MLDSALAAAMEYLRRNTAFPGWAVEFLIFFAMWTLARFGAALWDGAAGRYGEALTLWAAFWTNYDKLRAFADDSAIAALILTIIVEVIIMVLARKLLRINREEGREEGLEEGRTEGRTEGRAEVRAELEPVIEKLQEEIRKLQNGSAAAEPTENSPA